MKVFSLYLGLVETRTNLTDSARLERCGQFESGFQETLYELTESYVAVMRDLEELFEDNPDNPVIADTLEGMAGAFESKAINIIKFARNLEVTAAAIKEAEDKMTARRKALDRKVDWLKSYVKASMERARIEHIDSAWFNLSLQKNPGRVEIIDADEVPEKYHLIKTEERIDLVGIRDALKAGEWVPGAELVIDKRLVIK